MSEKKPMPKCPYCGAKMHLEDNEYIVKECYNDDETKKRYWYGCRNKDCGGTSPSKKTKWTAYRTAMRRYEAPNRVLTYEELKAYKGTVWVETNTPNNIGCAAYVQNQIVYMNSAGMNIHNSWFMRKHARCWLRKPTVCEMRRTPW